MNTWTLPIVGLLLLIGLSPTSARTFTNSAGQSFEGEILSVTPDRTKVTILRAADKQKFEVAVSMFTPENQKDILAWAKSNLSYSFTINSSFTTLKRSKARTSNSEVETKETGYEVELVNKTAAQLQDVKIEYMIFKKDGRDESVSYIKGTHKIAFLDLANKTEFITKGINIVEEDMDANWRASTKDGYTTKVRDELGGIWLKVYHNGKEVAESRKLDASLKGYPWGGAES